MELLRITCVLLIASFTGLTDGLFCYQCGSAGTDGHCKADIKGMAKSGRKVLAALMNSSDDDVTDGSWNTPGFLPYVKQCDVGRENCMIEEVVNSQTSGVLSYIRDCSDGKSFSFNGTALENLPANNFTTCGYHILGYLYCVSLCKDNFCNGPDVSTGSITELSICLLSICLLLKSTV